jgi:hypothetical protein
MTTDDQKLPADQTQTIEEAVGGVFSRVQVVEQEFENVVAFFQAERTREQRNWNLYSGLDQGQYTEDDKSRAAIEGRDLATFNLVTQKQDSLGGYILKNEFDSDFVPVESKEGIYTQLLKGMYLSDKQMMDWGLSKKQLVVAGLNYQGVEEMFIDRRYHPLGNIAFRCHLPGHVMFDPRWKSESGKDCQMAWVVTYYTASQILEIWPEKAKNLDFIIKDVAEKISRGENFQNQTDVTNTPNFDLKESGLGNNFYRIIRKFEMKTEEVTVEYDSVTGSDLPLGTDYAKKLAYLNKNRPEWEPEQIKSRVEKRRICWVTTVCRQLDKDGPLEEKPCEIQVGRLPLFPWSAARINGKNRGIADILYDIQQKLNYREELITNIIEHEAAGAKLADPMLFNDDEELKRQFVEKQNQPFQIIWTAPGALRQGLEPKPIVKATLPQDARDQLMRMWDYADRISKAPAVFDARSEKSGESGYLFAQKARVAEQQSYLLFDGLKQHEQEKAEAYMDQAKIQYTVGGIERTFMVRRGTEDEALIVNRRYFESVSGAQVERVVNDFANLPRHKVIISESPASTTNRQITRAVSTELLRVIDPACVGTRQVFTSAMVGSMDTFTEKQKAKLEKFDDLESAVAEETLMANLNKLKLANFQMAQQLEQFKLQASQPVPPPGSAGPLPPAPGGGAPPAGPAPAPAPPPPAPAAGGGQNMNSLEGGPVPPEKSAAYSGGGPK